METQKTRLCLKAKRNSVRRSRRSVSLKERLTGSRTSLFARLWNKSSIRSREKSLVDDRSSTTTGTWASTRWRGPADISTYLLKHGRNTRRAPFEAASISHVISRDDLFARGRSRGGISTATFDFEKGTHLRETGTRGNNRKYRRWQTRFPRLVGSPFFTSITQAVIDFATKEKHLLAHESFSFFIIPFLSFTGFLFTFYNFLFATSVCVRTVESVCYIRR